MILVQHFHLWIIKCMFYHIGELVLPHSESNAMYILDLMTQKCCHFLFKTLFSFNTFVKFYLFVLHKEIQPAIWYHHRILCVRVCCSLYYYMALHVIWKGLFSGITYSWSFVKCESLFYYNLRPIYRQ